MTRKEANMEILRQLKHYLTMNPDMRFGQALRNLGIIIDFQDPPGQGEPKWTNHFNEEPVKMLERVKETKKETV